MEVANYVEMGVGSNSGTNLISGTSTDFVSLPDPTLYTNKVYYVINPSGGFLSIINIYKYPKGLYVSDGTQWEAMPVNVKVSEDSTTLLNITNWSEFYNYALDIFNGDRIIFNDVTYKNITGSMTADSPDIDTTNWYSYAELEKLNDEIIVTSSGDDQGVEFQNQVSVIGEMIAGKDSYPVPLAFHATVSNTTGTVITGATDVTTILQSDSGSSTGVFDGTVAGNYLTIASSSQFEGVKAKYELLATVEPENVVAEVYINDTLGWQEIAFMATNSNPPHESTAWNFAVHDTEQIFFGFNPLTRDEESIWEQNTFTINGTEYSDLYWARYRLTDTITGDPQIQQVKLHTDRIEIESTGIFKYQRSRSKVALPFLIVKNDLSDPANEAVDYTPDYSADFIDNELANGTTDGFGLIINRIEGLDTSVPVTIGLSFYVKGTATGDIELTYQVSQITDDFVYDGTEPYDEFTKIITIENSQNLVRFSTEITAPINKLQANSGIVVNIFRDATATNANDTLQANIVRTNVAVEGYGWKF